MLGNLSRSKITAITVNLQSDQLNPVFRKDFAKVLRGHKGDIPLYVFLVDPATGYHLEFKSKKFQVEVSSSFIDELSRLGLGWKVATKK